MKGDGFQGKPLLYESGVSQSDRWALRWIMRTYLTNVKQLRSKERKIECLREKGCMCWGYMREDIIFMENGCYMSQEPPKRPLSSSQNNEDLSHKWETTIRNKEREREWVCVLERERMKEIDSKIERENTYKQREYLCVRETNVSAERERWG